MEERGFNDESVKKEHFRILKQNEDLSTKMRAVSDYYKLRGRYAPEEKKFSGLISLVDLFEQNAKNDLNSESDKE